MNDETFNLSIRKFLKSVDVSAARDRACGDEGHCGANDRRPRDAVYNDAIADSCAIGRRRVRRQSQAQVVTAGAYPFVRLLANESRPFALRFATGGFFTCCAEGHCVARWLSCILLEHKYGRRRMGPTRVGVAA